MAVKFSVSAIIPAAPEKIYAAWLNSKKHSAMTGGEAKVSAAAGRTFTAWDGYIEGRNLELDPPRRILQSWRTTEFAARDPASRLLVTFKPVAGGTRVTIYHSNLPAHGMKYKQGWVDAYLNPMQAYFEGRK